ncbi:hypothetical protein [Luteolibacter marinus]|uniref:hypothetical protein n=1 Tax=Luteolibacter marinus TaxID=2776705 RepID=UPI001D00CF15|nr:hypothetical protein [Luteolibacter marinus]
MKLNATLCAFAALFTGVVTFQILRKFAAMYEGMAVELPAHAGWMLWADGLLPTLLLVAAAATVFAGLAAGKNKLTATGGVLCLVLMVASATLVPAGIMIPLSKMLTSNGLNVAPAPAVEIAPDAVSPAKVGSYPSMVGKGGGYFYDEVLEYRVRVDSDQGDGSHFVRNFATYAEAVEFARKTPGAGKPLVLVMQKEWINEPQPGKFEPRKEVRLTEWQVEWLAGSKRLPDSIEVFLKRKFGPGGDGSIHE